MSSNKLSQPVPYNVWHHFNGDQKGPDFTAFIEIARGSKVKYELDKESGLLMVDRVLASAVHYPENYGFIPQSYCDDQDPLDVLVVSQESFLPGSLCHFRPIGVIKMIDKGESDDKVIGIHANDPRYAHIQSMQDLGLHQVKEMEQFFIDYKILEKKSVKIDGILDAKAAHQVIQKAFEDYRKKFQ